MLRLLVLLLILANGVYFAWTEGLLRGYGFGPTQQREPQRLAQQVRPEAIQLLAPAELKRVEAQARAEQTPPECWMAGPFDDAQAATLRQALESTFSTGSWQLESKVVTARWIVYMGKFASAKALEKKREELLEMNLVPQALANPDLEMGLSLGGFDTQDQAAAAIAKLALRGIRTAKVVLERAPGNQSQLKLPALTPEMKTKLEDIKLALAGRQLRSCNSAP